MMALNKPTRTCRTTVKSSAPHIPSLAKNRAAAAAKQIRAIQNSGWLEPGTLITLAPTPISAKTKAAIVQMSGSKEAIAAILIVAAESGKAVAPARRRHHPTAAGHPAQSRNVGT